MNHWDLKDLDALHHAPPPPSWSALDAEYEPPPSPTLAQATAPWIWGCAGFALGLFAATVLLLAAMGGAR
jgi:hypothetical protein